MRRGLSGAGRGGHPAVRPSPERRPSRKFEGREDAPAPLPQRVPGNSLPGTFSGVPVGAGGEGDAEVAELSGRCRSQCGRCCGPAPGARRGWKPRVGGWRVGWGLLPPGEGSGRAARREAGEGDGSQQVSCGAVASGRPERARALPAVRRGARVLAGSWGLPVLQRPRWPLGSQRQRCPLGKAPGSRVPGSPFFRLFPFPSTLFSCRSGLTLYPQVLRT